MTHRPKSGSRDDPGEGFSPETIASDGRSELLDALAHPRRRLALRVLSRRDGRVAFESLVDEVIDRDAERAVEREDRRERVRIGLHHRHLPKLAEAGLVEYDYEAGVVEPSPSIADEAAPWADEVLDRVDL